MKKSNYNVIFIGDTPLLYSCIITSLDYFNKIYLITKNKKIKRLLPKKIINIRNFKNTNLTKIDFVFSIMNEKIINKKILNIQNIKFINFHDGPLPRYAGLYSSTWAIINNEKYHGITWHEINDLIDGGNIYLGKKFRIFKNDTAESIDLRSNYYGLELFKKLINKIILKKITQIKQNLNKRTYYGLKDKINIPNNGFINYKDNVEKILKLSRALKFSKNKKNKLCKLKIFTSKGVFETREVFLSKEKKVNLYFISDLISPKNNIFFLKKGKKVLKFILKSKKLPKFFYLKYPYKTNIKKYINFKL